MKLEGSLDAFGLPDIFQLLSFTKKTGGLHLASEGYDGVVFFVDGQITGASADTSRQPLARRLIGAGVVDDDALSAAVEAAAEGAGVGVARALLDRSAIEADMVQQAVTDQSVDAVFDLLRWSEGDFAFVMGEGNPEDVGVAMPVESVLADANARQTSWEAVSQIVPSTKAVLAMPVVLPADPDVSREEWSLLALVDGRRTVAELVDLTGSGQFAVVSLLAGLVTRGLLDVRDPEDAVADHVNVVLRRHRILSALEDAPFTTVAVAATKPAEAVAEAAVEPAPPAPSPAAPAGSSPVGAARADATAPAPQPGFGLGSQEVASPALTGDEAQLVTVSTSEGPGMLGGAHVPGDVVPPRPEPFLPKRQADFEETAAAPAHRPSLPGRSGGAAGDAMGATATAIDPELASVIERDPHVNRSLMLRLIAGVRGL
jgi:hypothetical protein